MRLFFHEQEIISVGWFLFNAASVSPYFLFLRYYFLLFWVKFKFQPKVKEIFTDVIFIGILPK
jgi:hypothetical protein